MSKEFLRLRVLNFSIRPLISWFWSWVMIIIIHLLFTKRIFPCLSTKFVIHRLVNWVASDNKIIKKWFCPELTNPYLEGINRKLLSMCALHVIFFKGRTLLKFFHIFFIRLSNENGNGFFFKQREGRARKEGRCEETSFDFNKKIKLIVKCCGKQSLNVHRWMGCKQLNNLALHNVPLIVSNNLNMTLSRDEFENRFSKDANTSTWVKPPTSTIKLLYTHAHT